MKIKLRKIKILFHFFKAYYRFVMHGEGCYICSEYECLSFPKKCKHHCWVNIRHSDDKFFNLLKLKLDWQDPKIKQENIGLYLWQQINLKNLNK